MRSRTKISVLNTTRMLPRIAPMFLLICSLLSSSHVLGAPTQEPLLRISVNEPCPEKCMCTPVQNEPDLQDVICPLENYLNDEPPPEDASVQDLVEFVDTAAVEKNDDKTPEEILQITKEDATQDASVEESVITNMETKISNSNTTQEDAPKIDNIDDGTVVTSEVIKNGGVNNAEEEELKSSDEVDNDDSFPDERVKSILVEKVVFVQDTTQVPTEKNFYNDVMQGDQPQDDIQKEDTVDNEGEESDEIGKEEEEEEEVVRKIVTESIPSTVEEVRADITSDDDAVIVAKKGSAPIISEEHTVDQNEDEGEKYQGEDRAAASDEEKEEEEEEEEIPVETVINEQQSDADSDKDNKEEVVLEQTVDQNEDEGEKYQEGDRAAASDEEKEEEEEEEIPVETVIDEQQSDADSDKDNKEEDVLATDIPPAVESDVKPAESEKIPSEIEIDNDLDSDEVPDSDNDNNSDVVPVEITDKKDDNLDVNTKSTETAINATGSVIIQRIQAFEPEKISNSDIDNIILPDGEILFDPNQMDEAMSGKMISEGGEGSTQPQQSTASWVILGLILATFVGVIGYATVRGKMDKKNEAVVARVIPTSIPTANEIKMNRKPNIQDNEGTEMKVLSRPLLQQAEEENNTKEFRDKLENDSKNLQQVVIADVSDGIPYIDDSDGGQSTKPVNPVMKPARKRAPPPPITVPNSTHAPNETLFSPTTPTLVRTRIVDNSPQIARVIRSPNNNPFDE